MKFKYGTFLFTLLLFVFVVAIGYLKIEQYKIQIRNISLQLNNSQADYQQLSRDLNKQQSKYSACINDQIISVQFPSRNIAFTLPETGIFAPLLATQSGMMDVWDYKGAIQTEYQAMLPPYNNNFYILLILYKTDFPYLKNNCDNSPVDQYSNVCSAKKLNLSEFSFKGITKKGFPYYQKNISEYTTIIQLPQTDQQENRTIKISFFGSVKDPDYKQYLSLINDIDIKTY